METMEFRVQGTQTYGSTRRALSDGRHFSFEPRDERRIEPCNC